MTARLVKRRARKGEIQERWMADVYVEHPDGRTERVRKISPEQTRRGTERYERELRKQMLQGTRIDPKERRQSESPRFEDFAKEFLSKYAATTNKRSEQDAKESILRCHLVPAFGSKRLDEISTLDVDGYKAEKLAKKLAPKTINNHLTVLGRALRVAVEWGKLKGLPTIRWLKAPKPEIDFLTFEEAPRLLAAADAGQWRTMILVGLRAGLRQGEILALRWQDVDLTNGRLLVRRRVYGGRISTPKGGRSREVPLGNELVRALAALERRGGELVFSDDDGKMLTKGKCKWPLWRACKGAELRRIGWHVLRHTFASHLAMRGVPLKVIQELLGHATIEMTMRYAHLSPHVGREAVQLLDAGQEPPTGSGGTSRDATPSDGTAPSNGNLTATRPGREKK